jgi:hypothetical protein
MDSYRDFAARWSKCDGSRIISEHVCPKNGFRDHGVILIEIDPGVGPVWALGSLIPLEPRLGGKEGPMCFEISFCPFCGEQPEDRSEDHEAFSRAGR